MAFRLEVGLENPKPNLGVCRNRFNLNDFSEIAELNLRQMFPLQPVYSPNMMVKLLMERKEPKKCVIINALYKFLPRK